MIKNDSAALAKRVLSLIDLTSLNENDTEDTIKKLCQQASTKAGTVAAVCIYNRFVPLAKSLLQKTDVKVATVCNFPGGNMPLDFVIKEIARAIAAGADEIDVVMPYHAYLAGKKPEVKNFITTCKKNCGNLTLKVILETGALQDENIITAASEDAILAGADFIKTSTGKIATGATLEAAQAMLRVIARLKPEYMAGFKASGGVRTLAQAAAYLQLADAILGPQWATAQTFRFGASALLGEVLMQLQPGL